MPFKFRRSDLPIFDIEMNGNMEAFEGWKEQWQDYLDFFELAEENNATKAKVLRSCFSNRTKTIVRNARLTEEQKNNPSAIIKLLQDSIQGQFSQSTLHWQLHQRKQSQHESVDDFIFELHELARNITCCNEECKETLIKHQFIAGLFDPEIRKDILKSDNDIGLQETIKKAQALESTKKANAAIGGDDESRAVAAMRKKRPESHSEECYFCGEARHKDRKACPAFGQNCNFCGRPNHFQKCCHQYLKQSTSNQKTLGFVRKQAPKESTEDEESE